MWPGIKEFLSDLLVQGWCLHNPGGILASRNLICLSEACHTSGDESIEVSGGTIYARAQHCFAP